MTRTVAIVGRTLCGWIAAAALAHQLPRGRYRIIVVDTDADSEEGALDGFGDFAPVIAVPPQAAAFHAGLGLDEHAILRATGGGHALGVAFGGWRGDGAAAFLPYGETGAPLEGVAFHQLVARVRATGREIRLADYSVAALAAQAGRCAPASIPHALHLPTARYRALIRAAALKAGVEHAPAPLASAAIDAAAIVTRLALADGSTIPPLLVLDCSGVTARIAQQVAPALEDWSRWLPCDRRHVEVIAARGTPPPYSQVDANDAGWTATWPLNGMDVRLTCSANGSGERFRAGRRVDAWRGNCVALGAAAGMLKPLHPTALTLLLSSLARLIQLWPANSLAPVEAVAFNRATAAAWDGARDFVVAHHNVAGRAGPFWDERRAVVMPERLEAKRALFAARGRVPMFDEEPFDEADWTAMFDALGLVPRRYDARADRIALTAIEQHLAEQRTRAIAQVRALPRYIDAMAPLWRAAA
ncbi:tryptophan 7-halogenase [Sphingomonas sp.]|uniref:tryptophan 7-halogenase n=1 Tax=Sphingomonas sp. TaxID=28214 RepID=UPI0035C7DA33